MSDIVCEADPADPYKLNGVEQFRELGIVDGVYTVILWRQVHNAITGNQWTTYGGPIVPRTRTGPLEFIPFTFVSILVASPQIARPPLLGLVNASMKHCRQSADMAHGLHFTALPTLYITGINDDTQLHVGAAAAILLKDPAAKVGYAEFSGAGLGSLQKAIEDTEAHMAALGSAALSNERHNALTATEATILHSAQTSLLSATVGAVEAALRVALKIAAHWRFAVGEVAVHLNRDFLSSKLDPQTLAGLVAAYQNGALSLPQFLQAMVDGELLRDDTDVAAKPAKGPALVAA